MIQMLVKHLLLFTSYGAVFSFILVLAFFVVHLEGRSELRLWHTVDLDEEFQLSRASDIDSFEGYLLLEDRLFRQLRSRIYDQVNPDDFRLLNRYNKGSLSDPAVFGNNWNRSFEMPVNDPRGAVLLIHGLSDSPYTMRSLAQAFHDMEYWVVGLRLPGHGTAPSGLLEVTWQDFAAIVELAARYTHDRVGSDRPFYMAGFSTGAALAVEYSLGILGGEDDPAPEGLILLSPAIGVTPLAALAGWQAKFSRLPGFEKTAWESILPEYDPYRYKSFAVNAGDQIYLLTEQIRSYIDRLDGGDGVTGFPEVIAFQSVVDATVSTPDLVSGLFDRLATEGHELVLFDINRSSDVEPVLIEDPGAATRSLVAGRGLPFSLTYLTNDGAEDGRLVIFNKQAGISGSGEGVTETMTEMAWPEGVFALSHSSLPFPPDDSVYGNEADYLSPGIHLGKIDLLGETGVLLFPADEVIKLRYNPFHAYMLDRIKAFVGDK